MTAQKRLRFLIVNDDNFSVVSYKNLLQDAGYEVTILDSSKNPLETIIEDQPEYILCHSAPNFDVLEFFRAIRSADIIQPIFIVITDHLLSFNRYEAFRLGMDGYIDESLGPKKLIENILEIINHTMVIQFWGVRGTLPVPGKKTIHYGGNTNCVTLCFAQKHFLIFDAGTGIKELSNYLIKENKLPMSAKLLITHPHYDHINGIPYFVPLYMKGNEFDIYGTHQGDISIGKLLSGQMDSIYFPVTMNEFSAKLTFHNIDENEFYLDDLQVNTILLNHPGRCLGYSVRYQNKLFCYITDNELHLKDSPLYDQSDVDRLVSFIKDADVLVMDATYTDPEYTKKIGWGHSSLTRTVEIAAAAKVKLLCLYHHDPDQFDADITEKLKQAKKILKSLQSKTRCIAPREGSKLFI